MAGWKGKVGIGCLSVLALIVVIVGVLLIWQPWVNEREIVDPGQGGTRVAEAGIIGNYYAPPGAEQSPGILVMGGSEGGISPTADGLGRALRDAGFGVLIVSYFGVDGQPLELREIPLEYFDSALAWLADRTEIDGGNMAVVGYSKGAEAALLVAARNPQLRAVVAGVPSSVVWQGLNWQGFVFSASSSWTADDEPLPFLPFASVSFSEEADIEEIHRRSLVDQGEFPDAVIPVERIQARVLLLCGGRDIVWPSCPMADAIAERANDADGPAVTLLRYPEGGHGVLGPPVTDEFPDTAMVSLGDAAEATAAARADGWPQVVAHLRDAFGLTPIDEAETAN